MNCERCRGYMGDAATDGLSGRLRAEFEVHVQECTDCREEFSRVRVLLETIDRRVVSSVAVEPSPEFIARVRRGIATEDMPGKTISRWIVSATACAAAIILAVSLWQFWPIGRKPQSVRIPASVGSSLTAATHAEPTSAIVGEKVTVPRRKVHAGIVREVAIRKPKRGEQEPEVLVPPGEAEAVLRYVAALRSGEIDGAKLMAELKATDQPIELKPLVITPLDSSVEDNKGSGAGSDGTRRDLVSGEAIRTLAP